MKIKLDENISRHLKLPLQRAGHDVFTAADEGLLGKPDVEVGIAARSEGKILFTLDLEFADLRKFPPGTHPGIILFRPQSLGPLATNRFILNFVKETDITALSGCTVVVDPTRVRIRRPPLDTDTQEWLSHAKSDLRLAHLAATDELVRREQACFHAQQAAEKAIKAVLVSGGIEFPLIHDIEGLLEIVDTSRITPLKEKESKSTGHYVRW